VINILNSMKGLIYTLFMENLDIRPLLHGIIIIFQYLILIKLLII